MNFFRSVEFLTFLFVEFVSGDVWYECRFTDSVMPCSGFENKDVKAEEITLGMTKGSDDENPLFGLSGPLNIQVALDDSIYVTLNIFKATELGEEYMFKSSVSFCNSLKDPDAPWRPILEMMNITSCPVDPGSYRIEDMMISAEPFSDFMSHNFCGEYAVELSLTKDLDQIACYLVELAVIEHDED